MIQQGQVVRIESIRTRRGGRVLYWRSGARGGITLADMIVTLLIVKILTAAAAPGFARCIALAPCRRPIGLSWTTNRPWVDSVAVLVRFTASPGTAYRKSPPRVPAKAFSRSDILDRRTSCIPGRQAWPILAHNAVVGWI